MPLGLCEILVDFIALRAVTLWTLVVSDAFWAVCDSMAHHWDSPTRDFDAFGDVRLTLCATGQF